MKKMLEKFKKSKSSLALVILALVLIIAGISFALFNPSINLLGRRNIKISKCELDINFKESDELMLVSKYPISTRQALEGGYKPKKVTITNNSTCDMAYYKLTIKDLINSSINKDVIQYHVVDKQNTMTYKLGDVNNDTSITASDSTLVLRYLRDRAIKTTSSILKYAGDVDGDGKITENDNTIFAKYISKQITTFPAGAPLEEKTTTKEIIDVNPDTFLIESSLEKGKTHEYEIIMWISNAATNNDIYVNGDSSKPIEYKYALNIETSDEEIKNKSMTASEFALANVGKNGLEEVKESDMVTSYRYRGKNVANYVTFNNDVWRIIGMIPIKDADGVTEIRYKLIKSDATLNRVYDPDHVVSYYNSLDDVSKNMIINIYFTNDTGMWYANPKMHLMFVSDYNYASSTSCSKQCFSNNCNFLDDKENCITNNWLYYGSREYTFDGLDADSSGGAETVAGISEDGDFFREVFGDTTPAVHRPAVALSSLVKISGGSGTSSDPYQLSM